MNPKIKYWLEDNKDRLMLGGVAVILIITIIGGLLVLQRGAGYHVGETPGMMLADYIIVQTEDSDLTIIDVADDTNRYTWTGEAEDIVFRGENLDEMFVYRDNTVYRLSIVDDNTIELDPIFTVEGLDGVTRVIPGQEHFGFDTPDGFVVVDADGNTLLTHDDNDVTLYHLSDKGLYIVKDTELHYVAYTKQDTQYIDIGDKTTRISQHGDLLVVRNEFGRKEDTETVLHVSDGGLFIDELMRVPYDNKIDIPVPRDDTYLAYIHQRVNDDGEVTRQDLKTIVLQTDSGQDFISDITIPLDTTEPFSAETSLINQGYIYDWTDSGIRIIELRNGREVARIQTLDADKPFFVPININP